MAVDPSSWDHFIKASSKPKGYFGPTLAKPQIKGSYTFVNPQHSYHAESVEIVLAGFGSLTQKKKSYNVHFRKKVTRIGTGAAMPNRMIPSLCIALCITL